MCGFFVLFKYKMKWFKKNGITGMLLVFACGQFGFILFHSSFFFFGCCFVLFLLLFWFLDFFLYQTKTNCNFEKWNSWVSGRLNTVPCLKTNMLHGVILNLFFKRKNVSKCLRKTHSGCCRCRCMCVCARVSVCVCVVAAAAVFRYCRRAAILSCCWKESQGDENKKKD